MNEKSGGMSERLNRQDISDAVTGLDWRYVLGSVRTSVRVESLAQAANVAERAVAALGADIGDSLSVDIRHDRVILALQAEATASVTSREIALAQWISAVVSEVGLRTDPEIGAGRSVQALEFAIDALNIASVRPFWKAAMGYVDEPGASSPEGALVDPVGQGPAIWFQQMDAPRPQRNRVHLDVSVPHDEAHHRIEAALAAGGTMLSDAEAPVFWVFADAEGNEACITTWQGRDG